MRRRPLPLRAWRIRAAWHCSGVQNAALSLAQYWQVHPRRWLQARAWRKRTAPCQASDGAQKQTRICSVVLYEPRLKMLSLCSSRIFPIPPAPQKLKYTHTDADSISQGGSVGSRPRLLMAFFKNGKYAGQSFETIAAEDRRYSAWALREEREGGQLSRNLAGFVKHVKERHGGVMTIGKHRGQYRQAGHYRYRYRSHPQSPPINHGWFHSPRVRRRFICIGISMNWSRKMPNMSNGFKASHLLVMR